MVVRIHPHNQAAGEAWISEVLLNSCSEKSVEGILFNGKPVLYVYHAITRKESRTPSIMSKTENLFASNSTNCSYFRILPVTTSPPGALGRKVSLIFLIRVANLKLSNCFLLFWLSALFGRLVCFEAGTICRKIFWLTFAYYYLFIAVLFTTLSRIKCFLNYFGLPDYNLYQLHDLVCL